MRKVLLGGMLLTAILLMIVTAISIWNRMHDSSLKVYCGTGCKKLCDELLENFEMGNTKVSVKEIIEVDNIEEAFNSGKADIIIYINEKPGDVLVKKAAKAAQVIDLEGKGYALDNEEGMANLVLGGEVSLIYYNKRLFNELNLQVPDSMNDFRSCFALLRAEEVCPLAVALDTDGRRDFTHLADSIASGTDVPEEERQQALMEEIDYLGTVLSGGVLPAEDSSNDFSVMLGMLKEGKYAMLSGSSEYIKGVEDIGEEVGAFALPGNGIDTKLPFKGRLMSAFAKRSKNKRVVKEFADYLLSSKAQQLIYENCGFVPSVKGVEVDEIWGNAYNVMSTEGVAVLSYFDEKGISDLTLPISEAFEKLDLDYNALQE